VDGTEMAKDEMTCTYTIQRPVSKLLSGTETKTTLSLMKRERNGEFMTPDFGNKTWETYENGFFSAVAPCSRRVTLMMEAASTSEKSANFYQTTRRNRPEDSRRSENLKSHMGNVLCYFIKKYKNSVLTVSINIQ
jgi:hypothetical protein